MIREICFLLKHDLWKLQLESSNANHESSRIGPILRNEKFRMVLNIPSAKETQTLGSFIRNYLY